MPLISVIIPAYNAEETIRESIESVLNQTLSDFELIVIDDGSSDLTLKIVTSIQDSRIKVFSYRNGNASASRNCGVFHASGEFIAFLDADDLWTPDKLEVQLTALQKNLQAVVAYSWFDCIDECGKFLYHGSRFSKTGDVYTELLLSNILGNGSNPLIRRYALAEVGSFDESLTNSEDRDLYLRLAARYHFVAVPYSHILYRVSYKSKSFRDLFRSEASYLKLIEKAYTQAPKSLQHLKVQSFANHYNYLISKALIGPGGWQRSLVALELLWHYIIKIPGRFSYLRLKGLLLFKIFSSLLFQTTVKHWIREQFRKVVAK